MNFLKLKSLFWAALFFVALSISAVADDKDKKEIGHESDHNKKVFTVNIKSGTAPLLVNFDASKFKEAKRFFWNFGNGETLTTSANKINYTFKKGGTFLVTLKYSEKFEKKEKDKKDRSDIDEWKNGGSETIVVKELPKIPPEAYFTYFTNGTYIWTVLSKVKTQAEIKSAYYLFDNVDRVDLNVFYPNTPAGFDLKTLGVHSVKLIVEDINGLTSSFTHEVTTSNDPWSLAPYPRIKLTQSNINTVFVNMSESFNPNFDPHFNLGLRNFHLSMGDGNEFDINTDTFFTYTYASPGTYTVTLTLQNGNVTRSESKIITITNQSTPALSPISSFHSLIFDFASNVSFNAENSGTPNGEIISYEWDFGDGSIGYGPYIAHFYNLGTYLIKLTVTDSMGLRSTDTQQVIIRAPGDDLALSINCHDSGDLSLACEYFVLDKFNEINRILVRYGDNSEENLVNSFFPPYGMYWNNHVYKKGGTYNVELEVDTVRGYKRILTQTVNVNHIAPIADLSCISNSLEIYCSGLGSYDFEEGQLTYSFTYPDGFTEVNTTGESRHRVSSEGSQNIFLKVTTEAGIDAYAESNVVTSFPTPIAAINCVTNNMLVNCYSFGSYDPMGSNLKFRFDWGDNAFDESATPLYTHAYQSAGLYTVTVTVINDYNKTSSAMTQVMPVLPPNIPPVIGIVNCFTNGTPFRLDCISNSAYDPDGHIVQFKYLFDDGMVEVHSADVSLYHQFSTAGIHKVILTITDNDGAETSTEQSFTVNDNIAPTADFVCGSYGPQRLSCYSTSSDQNYGDQIINFKWDFGDQGTFESLSWGAEHTYLVGGVYKVKLTVTDQYGGIASVEKDVDVRENQAPIASINCFPTTGFMYQCNANAYDPDGKIVEYNWNIDGVNVTGNSSVQYEFTNGGIRNIALTLKDDLGKMSSYSLDLTIEKIAVDFNCDRKSPYVFNCSFVAGENFGKEIIKYLYVIDDRDVRQEQSFSYTFLTSGNHKIKLTVLGSDGNESSVEKIVNVPKEYINPEATFTSFANPRGEFKFDASDVYSNEREIVKFVWDFGDATTLETMESVINHTYSSYGLYRVSLTIFDSSGSSNTIYKEIEVYDAEVMHPAESYDDALEGLDSDSDGIRDEVQRWINYESKNNFDLKTKLKNIAKIQQLQLINAYDVNITRTHQADLDKKFACLQGTVDTPEEYEHLRDMFEYLKRNNELRSKNAAQVEENLLGYQSMGISSSKEELLKNCE